MSHEPHVASWLSRRDDRARVVSLAVITGSVGALTNLLAVGAALLLALALVASTRQGPRRVARRLWPLLTLLVPLGLLTPSWYRPPGATPLLAGWGWGPTDAGVALTAVMMARVLAMALLAVAFLGAAPFERTLVALQDLRLPRALTHTALLTQRYLFVFRDDVARARAALHSRGFLPRADVETARTYAALAGGLLVRSLARTERVERAMRCRGYAGELAQRPPAALRVGDALLVLLAATLAGALLAWDRGVLP